MLQKLAEASNSYMRADECDERARQAPDETLRASYVQLSKDLCLLQEVIFEGARRPAQIRLAIIDPCQIHAADV